MSLFTIMLLTGEVTTFIFIFSFRNKISCLRFASTRFRGGIPEHDRMYLLCTQHNGLFVYCRELPHSMNNKLECLKCLSSYEATPLKSI